MENVGVVNNLHGVIGMKIGKFVGAFFYVTLAILVMGAVCDTFNSSIVVSILCYVLCSKKQFIDRILHSNEPIQY